MNILMLNRGCLNTAKASGNVKTGTFRHIHNATVGFLFFIRKHFFLQKTSQTPSILYVKCNINMKLTSAITCCPNLKHPEM